MSESQELSVVVTVTCDDGHACLLSRSSQQLLQTDPKKAGFSGSRETEWKIP
jgi:hypothetical protein